MTFFSQSKNQSGLENDSAVRRVISRFEGVAGKGQGPLIVWLASTLALGLTTWVCFRLGFDASMVKCLFLIPIVFLSMMNGFVASMALCAVVILSIDFFSPSRSSRFIFRIARI